MNRHDTVAAWLACKAAPPSAEKEPGKGATFYLELPK
jgi:hypothetical protein